MREEDLTVVEAIGLAIRSEEDAAKFYGDLSKRIRNGLVRTKYDSLAREESSHRQMLLALYRRITGEDRPPHIPGSPALAEGRGVPPMTESIEALLQYAITREQEAQAFYRRLGGRMTEPASRRTIEYLAEIERGHELLLAAELEAFLRDKTWYADNPDIQLVGP